MVTKRWVPTAPGVQLFVAGLDGSPSEPLLVVHGGPDWDHSYLVEPIVRLGGRCQVLLPDLRGCGRSTVGLRDDQYTPDAAVGDLLAVLDRLRLDRVAVLGFSYGGLLAQRLTVAAPERVCRLIVASSSVLPTEMGSFDTVPDRASRMAAEEAVWSLRRLSDVEQVRAAAVAGADANVWGADARADYLDRIRRIRFTAEWARPWRAGTLPSARLSRPIEELAATGVPLLLLHGAYDMTFPAELAHRAAELLPNAEAVVLDDAAHMAHIDQPDQWIAAVSKFLGIADRG